MDIVVHGSREGVLVFGINNLQLPEAFKQVLAECKRQYGGIPVEISVTTWDMDYGDIVPEACITARPKSSCWAFERRLNTQQQSKAGA